MKLSDYGPNTNVYELMTWLFPGVRFGEFHEKMDPEHFSETTGKCSLVKTRFWIEIENEFKKCSSKPSDFFDFIKYLSEYKASGKEIVFKQCFPYIDSSNSANSIFSCSILLNQLAPLNPLKKSDEIEQLIKDCDILNGKTLKGGLFLYCARILDSKFLSFFYGKGQNDEKFIYKLLKYYDSQIAANKTQFPVSSIFNESNRWGIDWEAQYVYGKNNRCKYRFSWQKDKDEHWQTLYYYKPSNPYEYFIHECQTRYTLVRIGYESTSSLIKRAKDIKEFNHYSEKGMSEVFAKIGLLKENEGITESKILREFYEKNYHEEGSNPNKDLDYEGNILIGIEIKDGAKKITNAFFVPKNLKATITEIRSAIGKKKNEKQTQHTRYKIFEKENTKLHEILSSLYIYDKQIDELKNYLHIFTAHELNEINKIISNVNKISVSELKLEQEEEESLQNKNENPYKLLKILRRRVIRKNLSKSDNKKITDFTNNLCLQEPYKTLEFLTSENVQIYLSEEDKKLIKKYSSYANTKTESLDSPQDAKDGTTLHDKISEDDVINKEVPSSKVCSDDISGYKSQKFKDLVKYLNSELSKNPDIEEKKITKYLNDIWKDYKKTTDKTSFIATLEKDIVNFNVNCSDEELNNNYYVKTFLKSEKSFPKDTVFNMFREILYRMLINW